MTREESVLAFRLQVLREVERVGNVSATCRMFDVSRTRFDEWLAQWRQYGADELRPNPTGAPRGRLVSVTLESNTACWRRAGPGRRVAPVGQRAGRAVRGPTGSSTLPGHDLARALAASVSADVLPGRAAAPAYVDAFLAFYIAASRLSIARPHAGDAVLGRRRRLSGAGPITCQAGLRSECGRGDCQHLSGIAYVC